MKKISLLLLFVLYSLSFASHVKADCSSAEFRFDEILKEVNLIQDSDHYVKRTLDEQSLCDILTVFKRILPKSSTNLAPIDIVVEWDNGNSNAFADYEIKDKKYKIIINGGLLSAKNISEFSIPAVICHEYGHILGGVPSSRLKLNGKEVLNVSEGLSDYYATHKCLKKYHSEVLLNVKNAKLNRISKICLTSVDQKECLFMLNASYEAQSALTYLNGGKRVNFEIPSEKIVKKTLQGYTSYPDPECRFDSMVAGYFCNNKGDLPCGFNKQSKFVAVGDTKAHPPKCFFKD